MENDENKSIFTFDPGEPPEGFIPDEENAKEDVVFDWDPSYDADIYPEMSDLNSVSEEDEGTESGAGHSFLERCRDFFRSVKLPSVKVQLPAMKSIFKNKYVIRRAVALALIALLILVPAVSLIIRAVRNGKPVTTENVGPLPSDEVAVHRVPVYYDYGKPAPESPGSTGYFNDAVIVGDTRLVQLLPTYGIGSFQKVLYGTAVSVSNVLEYDNVNADGEPETFISALTGKQYGKIYICLGLNELGWAYPEVFEEDYRTLITQIRSIQPTALIYLLAIVPVNEAQFDNDYIYNTRIQQYNSMILSVAESNRIYYVDCYAGMADASGALNPSYTSDGFYINETGAEAWWNYIASHTVDPEVYEN